jgi:CDP-glucose 4,6-dehydratase
MRVRLDSAFNFGPPLDSNRTVAELVREILRVWPGRWEDQSDANAVHEAKLLNLAIDKAHHLLKWRPVWNFEGSVEKSVQWYRQVAGSPAEARSITEGQISQYTQDAKRHGVRWASDAE